MGRRGGGGGARAARCHARAPPGARLRLRRRLGETRHRQVDIRGLNVFSSGSVSSLENMK